jgi:hypothetical protein
MNRRGSTSISRNATIGRISANGPPTPSQSTECSGITTNNSMADQSLSAGRWVMEARYSEIYSISRQTLANWRYRDRRSGRTEAVSGFPKYRRFGKAIRYLLEGE